MTTTTRLVGPGDRDEWLSLFTGYLTFYQDTMSPELAQLAFDRLIDPSVDLHGAIAWVDDHDAVGLVHWATQLSTRTEPRHCHLDGLFVHPDARGSGAGSALVSHVRSWAQEQGVAKVLWLANVENKSARAVYDRFAEPTMYAQYEIRL